MERTVLVVDPVVRGDMTTEEEYLRSVADAGTNVRLTCLPRGPSSIETFCDEVLAVAEMLPMIAAEADSYDAIVVNCMADPGVRAVRELVDVPVVGPAEASVSLALQLGHRFAIVTIMANGGPWTELQVRAMGLGGRMAAAVGIDIPVLDLATDQEATTSALLAAARDCVERLGADVIVLGCTAMQEVARRLASELDVPVVEPVAAALKTAEALATLGLKHSHRGLYMSFASLQQQGLRPVMKVEP